MIQKEAIQILNKFNIENNSNINLTFSLGWISDFMVRNHLSVRQKTHIAQQKIYNVYKDFEYLDNI